MASLFYFLVLLSTWVGQGQLIRAQYQNWVYQIWSKLFDSIRFSNGIYHKVESSLILYLLSFVTLFYLINLHVFLPEMTQNIFFRISIPSFRFLSVLFLLFRRMGVIPVSFCLFSHISVYGCHQKYWVRLSFPSTVLWFDECCCIINVNCKMYWMFSHRLLLF